MNPNDNNAADNSQSAAPQPAQPQQAAPQPQQTSVQQSQQSQNVPPAATPNAAPNAASNAQYAQNQQAPQFNQPSQQQTPVDVKESVNKFADSMGKQHIRIGNYDIAYGNLVTSVGAVLAIIGLFLPFAGVNMFNASASVSLMPHGIGWILLFGAVAIGVLAVLRQEIAALTITIIYALLVIYEIANAGSSFGSVNAYSSYINVGASYGAGMWLLVIAIIVMLVGTIVAFYNAQRAKKATAQNPPANPAFDSSYQNNGWQFGVPAQQQPSNVDNSNWQFGVENPPAGAQAATPASAPTAAPASTQVPPFVPQQPFQTSAPTAQPQQSVNPQAPAAPSVPAPYPTAGVPSAQSQPTMPPAPAAPTMPPAPESGDRTLGGNQA